MDSAAKVNSDPRRSLPSVDRLIAQVGERSPGLAGWAVAQAARETVAKTRQDLSRGDSDYDDTESGRRALVERVSDEARRLSAPHPRPVINATGVLLHTNLGRAPLSPSAATAVARALDGYSNLELDLATGRRGARLGGLEAKLRALCPQAEAAHVVNNNAAAVLLALNTLALGRSVVVSRGELVEIGGSFRVPAIMERAGVRLREVGTTNRTHLADYADAIDGETALLLKVHRSNFEQRGFVAEASVRSLAELAHERGIPLIEDLGSGTLVDLAAAGLPEEAFAPSRLALGVDVVCFSGDKLLGGPQAGILLGRREPIEAMRRNPLARALRVDKLTIAALDATLDRLLESAAAASEIPVIDGLSRDAESLLPRARSLLEQLSAELGDRGRARLERSEAAVGGGSLPEHRLPGWAVVVDGVDAARVAARLREAPTPVLARVRDDAVWLDVRTLRDRDLAPLREALEFALA